MTFLGGGTSPCALLTNAAINGCFIAAYHACGLLLLQALLLRDTKNCPRRMSGSAAGFFAVLAFSIFATSRSMTEWHIYLYSSGALAVRFGSQFLRFGSGEKGGLTVLLNRVNGLVMKISSYGVPC